MDQLRRTARQRVERVWNDPLGRLALREAFYARYGGTNGHGYGYGDSELAFLRWEIDRGVLGPVGAPSAAVADGHPAGDSAGNAANTGSRWWKSVNGEFLYVSQLAALAFEAGAIREDWEPAVRLWLDYLEAPSAQSWYRAHNSAIVRGYIEHADAAFEESAYEQAFINIVLYRVLFAQSMVNGESPFGELGRLLANPRLPAVDLVVALPDFYPQSYPLTRASYEALVGGHFTLEDLAVRALDEVLVLPQLTELYRTAAALNRTPELTTFEQDGKPIYPPRGAGLEPGPALPEKVMTREKKKIAILGGGIASLATAFELSAYPNWQDAYEITLYQKGWRLGGKMAGGRGPHGRVEELGLHLLLGFYTNAFPLFVEAYEERTARGLAPDSPYKTLHDAILPNNGILLVGFDKQERRWVNWPLVLPPSPGYPGDDVPLTTWQLVKRGLGLMLEVALGSPYAEHLNPLVKWLLDQFFPPDGGVDAAPVPPSPEDHSLLRRLGGELKDAWDRLGNAAGARVVALVHGLDPVIESMGAGGPGLLAGAVDVIELVVRSIEDEARELVGEDTSLNHMLILLDFGLAMAKGLLTDVWNPDTGKFDYRRINDQDLRDWLRGHGASDATLYSPVVTFFYKGTFESLDDNAQRGGLLAAGTALQFFLPALGYKGAFCNQLRLGTADTLIMPLYQVLAARGVKFEFFHEVTNVRYTAATQIEQIELQRQVDLVVERYDPKVLVKGNPCWPAQPLYDQLDPAQARQLQEANIDLESPWTSWKGAGTVSLTRGRDFDLAVLGIPAKAQAQCCHEIIAARPDWRDMVEKVHSAQVMSMQLWIAKDLEELGFDREAWGMGTRDTAPNVVTYADPLFSWLDQTQIIENEAWPEATRPRMLAMFTGILPDETNVPPFSDTDYPARQHRRVQNLCWQWLMDNMGFFFPAATPPAYPQGFDLTVLRGLDPLETDGRRKFADQFFEAAINPSDQYVIAVPDTEQYRLRPDGSGFDNLYLVGDWTDYGVNIGYMEGCIVSAHQAVAALLAKLGRKHTRTWYADPLAG